MAGDYVARGYVRLNRDQRGGALRELAHALDDDSPPASAGSSSIQLIRTRAARSYAIETAAGHGVAIRCGSHTPLAPGPGHPCPAMPVVRGTLPVGSAPVRQPLQRPGVLAPTSQMRTLRELEPPSTDEGFARVDTIAFTRDPPPGRGRAGVLVAAAALESAGWEHALEQADLKLAAPRVRTAARGLAGIRLSRAPPPCGRGRRARRERALPAWGRRALRAAGRRPPLPGLPLAFARAHGARSRTLDPDRRRARTAGSRARSARATCVGLERGSASPGRLVGNPRNHHGFPPSRT